MIHCYCKVMLLCCALFGGLPLGAPCIRPVYIGVLCFFFFSNLYIHSFTYQKKKKNLLQFFIMFSKCVNNSSFDQLYLMFPKSYYVFSFCIIFSQTPKFWPCQSILRKVIKIALMSTNLFLTQSWYIFQLVSPKPWGIRVETLAKILRAFVSIIQAWV